ncbi:MAG: hypothetical protein H0V56_13095 [Chthoniobacterales bacterium]|nr:hypothetical protein [Chthoniobacterales bacterium]
MSARASVLDPLSETPIYVRQLPELRLGVAWALAVVLFVLGLAAWEAKWRADGVGPTYRNSDAAWAMQRRRIDTGEGDKTVLIGSSRILFDVQLAVWQRVLGERPIQLSQEGTSPIFALENLADDPDFTGRLVVGVSPPLFFSAFDRRAGAFKYYRDESLSQRAGQWLSMRLLEPFFAFYDDDFALMTVLKRQDWPARAGVPNSKDVRRLSVQEADRNTRMWDKVERDAEYNALVKSIWLQILKPPPGVTPEMMQKLGAQQVERAVAAVAKLRARGVPVIFLRAPSDGPFLEVENKAFPRAATWDVLLQRTGAHGIHFEDYPELGAFTPVEWSHLSGADAERFTEALCQILERDFGWPRRRG